MAYIVPGSFVATTGGGSGSTITANISSLAQENDICVGYVMNRFGSAPSVTTSGFAEIYSGTGNFVWKLMGSTPDTTVQWSSTATLTVEGSFLIRGAHTTAPFSDTGASQYAATSAVSELWTGPSGTPTHDDTLVLHFVTEDTSSSFWPVYSGYELHENAEGGSNAFFMLMDAGTVQSGTAVTGLSLCTAASATSLRMGLLLVRDDGNGHVVGCNKVNNQAGEIIATHGSGGGSTGQVSNSSVDLTPLVTSVTGSDGAGRNTAVTGIAAATGGFRPSAHNGRLSVSSSGQWGTMRLAGAQFASAHDLSSSKVCQPFYYASSRVAAALYPSIGLVFADGATGSDGAKMWPLGGQDSTPGPANGWVGMVVSPGAATERQEWGTFDDSAVTHYGFSHYHIASNIYQYLAPLRLLGTLVMVQGSSTLPATLSRMFTILQSDFTLTIAKQGDAYMVKHDIDFGDGGTTPCYIDLRGETLQAPVAFDDPEAVDSNVGTDRYLRRINLSGVDNYMDVRGVTFDLGGTGSVEVVAVASSATFKCSQWVVRNGPVTLTALGSGAYDAGIIFDNCAFTLGTADLSNGATWSNAPATEDAALVITGATQAALQAILDRVENSAFVSNATALRIEYTGTGDITLNHSGASFTGNTVDYHYNATNASALTINLQGGNNASTSATSGSATGVTLSNDVTFTVNISETGAELTILTTGTQTEQHHVETAGTSEAFTFTAPLGVNVDIQVFKPGFIRYWEENRDLGTTASSITVNLESDLAYAA